MENLIETKSFSYAVAITNLSRELSNDKKEFIIARQLLKSGTAVGALIAEAKFAQSKADFISKMSIGLKEANESSYWLRLLKATKLISIDSFTDIYPSSEELVKLLSSIVKTSKENAKSETTQKS